jgi:acetylornithine/N-succinyldiaminopimelate aminotransferase
VSATAVAPVLATYARQDVTFIRGEGSWLWDDAGRRYLDLFAGIAVVGLGHCHPAPLAAAEAQLNELWHVSNLYWTQPMQELATRLSQRFGGAHAFFCNSGAEAVEAALKHARKATGKPGVVALDGSFHGRTLGALSVTGQPAKRAAFEPLVPGASFVPLNDVDALTAAVGGDTGAILLEPVQGEGGVHAVSPEFIAAARELADEHGALLVLDEVQTGIGRTGTFFAFEQLGVKPDVVTLAKGLANGLPIGALLVADGTPEGLVAGDHASTFGGNPVAAAAACAVIDAIDDALLADVRRMSAFARERLVGLPGVTDVRGVGLLLAAEIDGDANAVATEALAHGLVVGTAGPSTLRLTPALTIADDELALGLGLLEEVLR